MRSIGASGLSTRDLFEVSIQMYDVQLDAIKAAQKHLVAAVEALGREIAGDEYRVTEPDRSGAPHVSPDGTGMPTHKTQVEGRYGKQPDGSANTREAKIADVWFGRGQG